MPLDIFNRIQSQYEGLSRTQKNIADYLLSNPDEACFLSLKAFAEKVKATEVTVINFSHRIGLNGFSELKSALCSHVRGLLTPNDKLRYAFQKAEGTAVQHGECIANELQILRETFRNLSPDDLFSAVSMLETASRVYLIGYDSSMPVAQFMLLRLRYLGLDAEPLDFGDYSHMMLEVSRCDSQALFIIISDTDDTFNFLASMVYTQLFNLLCDKADDVYGGRLPVHVRCLIDECANIGQIPKLEKLMATIRSREISACLVLQAQSQLKALYKDNCDTIIGNCDSSIFLGGKEPTTLKELSAALGKETIDTFNTGESRGREVSHSLNYQKLGKELMSQDELAVLNGGKCILQLRGVRPFLSDKYDITKHPNYKYLSDANPKNAFDIEKFLSTKLKLKPEEEFEVFDTGVAAGSESA